MDTETTHGNQHTTPETIHVIVENGTPIQAFYSYDVARYVFNQRYGNKTYTSDTRITTIRVE